MIGEVIRGRKENGGSEMEAKVTDYFYKGGLNCAESTLRVLIERGVIDAPIEAVRMMSGFGGGVQRGELCGCITGAVAAIGYVTGRTNADESRKESADAVRAFLKEFEGSFGALTCRDLNQKYAKEHALKSEGMYRSCTVFVEFACETAAKIIEEAKKEKVKAV